MHFRDLGYTTVAGFQIIKALNRNLGLRRSSGVLYEIQQAVANDARKRGLLQNLNPGGPAAFGDTHLMTPSEHGWPQVKVLQRRWLEHFQTDSRMDKVSERIREVSARLVGEG